MSEKDMLIVAVGALSGVIATLSIVIGKLYKDLKAAINMTKDFAETIIKRGDACEIIEKVTGLLQGKGR